jgi:hypothetical protein
VDVASKLQLKADQELTCVSLPDGMVLEVDTLRHGAGDDPSSGLLVFAVDRAALDAQLAVVVEGAGNDRLTWVAYPKGGQLGTDLNRDQVAAHLSAHGIEPVRQIAIDEVWSALRFRRS